MAYYPCLSCSLSLSWYMCWERGGGVSVGVPTTDIACAHKAGSTRKIQKVRRYAYKHCNTQIKQTRRSCRVIMWFPKTSQRRMIPSMENERPIRLCWWYGVGVLHVQAIDVRYYNLSCVKYRSSHFWAEKVYGVNIVCFSCPISHYRNHCPLCFLASHYVEPKSG